MTADSNFICGSPEKASTFQETMGYAFRNPDLLLEALTHSSSLTTRNAYVKHNERLEFLGDAVLGLIVSEYLTVTFPEASEGTLSKIKAHVVNKSTLSQVARRLNVGAYLILGRGEELNGGREKISVLADAIEAAIGALYLDSGYREAQSFVLRMFDEELNQIDGQAASSDHKSHLQEVCQSRFGKLPTYHMLKESGPDHLKTFEIELRMDGRSYGIGIGKTKKEAEQQAAKQALHRLLHPPPP